MKTFTYLDHPEGGYTLFESEGQRVWLRSLFRMTGAKGGKDDGPIRTQGLFHLACNLGRFEGASFEIIDIRQETEEIQFLWQVEDIPLHIQSNWTIDSLTGVISRKDSLINTGTETIIINRCLPRFVFTPGNYEVYFQESRWSKENQGAWHPLQAGSVILRCEWGRTTQGNTPYACLRDINNGQGLVLHVIPKGNWIIRFNTHSFIDSQYFIVMEAGLSDEDLHLSLHPGEVFQLPELLLQALQQGKPELAASSLHCYLQNRFFHNIKEEPPLVYNTWFDQFDYINLSHLEQQLEAAQEVGCEIFVIDAGWYGPGGADWWNQVGDWREKTGSALMGRMVEFSERVRAAGLGFGIWMEPERFVADCSIRQTHPEWFTPGSAGMYRINLEEPLAYAYIRGEIERLIETYQLAWMKVDFNFELGYDPSGAELARYYEKWYRLLDEIREKYPKFFLEGCASGGMRTDLNTLSHFDAHFLSDTVEPIDTLRISQGAWLRLPPGRLEHWLTMRNAGNGIAHYGKPPDQWPDTLIVPGGAGWQAAEVMDFDFAAISALSGVYGLSGDLLNLSKEMKTRLIAYNGFYKTWRKFITASMMHFLTPPRPIEERSGWIAFQMQNLTRDTSLVFAYFLSRFSSQGQYGDRFQLFNLDPGATYRVKTLLPAESDTHIFRGEELLIKGLEVELLSLNSAVVILIQKD